jgi:hypothetical protein
VIAPIIVRSTVPAVAIAVAWMRPLEHIVQGVWADAGRWFPGLLLNAITRSGTDLAVGLPGSRLHRGARPRRRRELSPPRHHHMTGQRRRCPTATSVELICACGWSLERPPTVITQRS